MTTGRPAWSGPGAPPTDIRGRAPEARARPPGHATASSSTHRRNEEDPRALMERVHRGERAAMDELIALYWDALLIFAAGIVGSADEAEDVVQDVLLKVWERRADWTPTGRPVAFLYRVTRNEALNHRRDARTRHRILGRVPPPSRKAASPEDDLESAELSRQVRSAIDSLPPRRREVFILARFHGRSYREIAEILGISPQTVGNQLSSAVSQLRVDLRPIYDELQSLR